MKENLLFPYSFLCLHQKGQEQNVPYLPNPNLFEMAFDSRVYPVLGTMRSITQLFEGDLMHSESEREYSSCSKEKMTSRNYVFDLGFKDMILNERYRILN
jgi:hypothetical protein